MCAVSIVSFEALAADRIESEVRIDRQPLLSAMWQLDRQTKVVIFSLTDKVVLNAIMVGPVVGTLSPAEALQQLLDGTGFIFRKKDPTTYEILSASVIQEPTMPGPRVVDATRAPGRNIMTVNGKKIRTARSAPERARYDARSLDHTGASTVGGLLPIFIEQPNALPETALGDGAQCANLRGLGMDMTTILVNGHRLSSTATSGIAFDLNNIPLSATESVDVLDDAAAAELGIRSIGGAVNIQLKQTYSEPTVRLAYGAAEGGAEQRQIVLSLGSSGPSLMTGLSVEYFDRSELPGDARAFSRDQDFSRYGGADYRSLASWPGNISSITGAPLPGLSSPYAAVPVGTADGDPQISDFQSTAGLYRLDSLRRYSSLLPEARRLSLVGTAEYWFESVPNLRVFGELIGVDRWTEYQFTPPTLTNALVPASNAFNPFGEAVYVSRLLSELAPRQVATDARWLRVLGGVSGDLGSWGWEVTASSSEESASRSANHALAPVQLASALASSDRNLALNVFDDGPAGRPELMTTLVAAPSVMDFDLTGSAVTAELQGSVFSLPRGDVDLLLGAEWRQETTSSTRTMSTWHADVFVPLWGDALTAAASIRSDQFSDLDRVFTPAYALAWTPSEWLQLRVSHSTGFRAPSLQELYGASHELQFPIADHRRNGEVRNVTVQVGSSPQIQTVTGNSTAASARIRLGELPGMEIVAKYWRKRVDNRIMAIPMSLVLEHEAAFAGHIVRDAPTAEDLAAGRPGILRSLDLLTTQLGGIDASGIDTTISYQFNRNIRAELSATWMDEFATYDVPGAAPTNRIGIANPRGTITRWRGFAKLSWQNGVASATVSARYVGPYEDVIGNQRTGRQLDSQTSIDVQASVDLGRFAPGSKVLGGLALTAGMLNILNTPPQFAVAGEELGYDASLSDPRQRFAYLRIEKRFQAS